MKVSVWMITYNHEKYIAHAIESVLCQVTDFDYEIVIGDDFSTDNTRQIISIYYEKHPEIIKPLLHEKNVGIAKNVVFTLEACKGKYIALLEGDDYWIDKYKLQKQVDFLEKNQPVSLCYTQAKEVNEITGEEKIVGKEHPQKTDLKYLLEHGWYIRTATIMFPKIAIKNFPEWFFQSYSTDYILHILLAENGLIVRLDGITAVYRRHAAGISAATIEVQQKRWIEKLELLKKIDKYFNYEYRLSIRKQAKMYRFALGVSFLKHLKNFGSVHSGLKYLNNAGLSYSFKSVLKMILTKMRVL